MTHSTQQVSVRDSSRPHASDVTSFRFDLCGRCQRGTDCTYSTGTYQVRGPGPPRLKYVSRYPRNPRNPRNSRNPRNFRAIRAIVAVSNYDTKSAQFRAIRAILAIREFSQSAQFTFGPARRASETHSAVAILRILRSPASIL